MESHYVTSIVQSATHIGISISDLYGLSMRQDLSPPNFRNKETESQQNKATVPGRQ